MSNPRSNVPEPDPNDVLNPGDKVPDRPQSEEEKAEQTAVSTPDPLTGDYREVPTYFEVEEPDGERKQLHHVRDAEEISDTIREARTDEEGNRVWW
ncbi:MAG: hypothetical protein BRC40_03500 [Cyanobacteria bacterium QH_8_48_120]|jgi:hypothetical protein|nr:MAG: hypothetical protein BRC34_02755 [Cyanobacteria bacterium QH_1_48_107]PSO57716.1 MAG: hypothetical protein BRC35_07005 [Cyanobacteria bacterium QH_10_48_56]PSO59549.1 MAG: hypothetical protein BRC36_15510 [Cyanobacteria bacterium QH_2_48_84]PSO61919.1 MAG: hypothetical protein BRC39_07115 [Cyanobacteria bacterium QH_7_48_89]PSO66892.1 MAG: hypothetical protein BRC38_04450 [Cyanobacteria bacterium QH_6_48_35]PSO70941.1 MAG: hypothetical protein BRC37_14715 [Cyanobacteria bacterium QH_3_